MKKIFTLIIAIFLISISTSFAEYPYYLDFKYVLNESEAGKKAQTQLK